MIITPGGVVQRIVIQFLVPILSLFFLFFRHMADRVVNGTGWRNPAQDGAKFRMFGHTIHRVNDVIDPC